MDNSVSLISRDNSICIKGILIFLIILGHNMCFTRPTDHLGIMSFLYTFHIQGFFILPFLYGCKPFTKDEILKNLVRFYWPYFVLATMLMIGYGSISHYTNINLVNLIKLYFCGGDGILRTMCGYAVLWFLPTIMFILFFRDIYYHSKCIIRTGIILLSLYFNIQFIFDWKIPYIDNLVSIYLFYPMTALRYFLLGVICRWILQRKNEKKYNKIFEFFLVLIFIGVVIYLWLIIPLSWKSGSPWYRFIKSWLPVPFFVVIMHIVSKNNNRRNIVLKELGKFSLPIYLVSPFIGYAAYFMLKHFHLICWETGIIVQFIITTIAYLIAKYLIRGKLRKFLIPRNITELKGVFGLK